MYQKLKSNISRTVNVFKKHDKEHKLPEYVTSLKPVNKLNQAELVNEVNRLSNFLMSDMKSYKSYQKRRSEDKERAERNLGYTFKSEADFDEYEKFLHEMYIRDKDNWKQHYEDAMDLFVQSRRLNLNPKQFQANYEYWLENAEELLNAEPINKSKVYPSDYARQLKLPKVRGGGDYE